MKPYFMSHFQVEGNFESTGSTADTITTQTMTVDDLSSTYTPQQSLAVLYQQDATGRRCHKTLRGGGEAVWPPNLEAALISGLQAYSDRYQLHTRYRGRGRFIGRNHFLSDFVRWATGRRRSAKQVGSRLQQLKETCRDNSIHFLITGRRMPSQSQLTRRHKKSSSKRSSRRSISSTPEIPELSYESYKEDAWESEEQTPEPQDYQSDISAEYALQSKYHEECYPDLSPPVPPLSVGYETQATTCSYPNTQPTAQYYASSDYYVQPQEWRAGVQQAQPTYQFSAQEWDQYYSHQQPQQVAYYGNSQYY